MSQGSMELKSHDWSEDYRKTKELFSRAEMTVYKVDDGPSYHLTYTIS